MRCRESLTDAFSCRGDTARESSALDDDTRRTRRGSASGMIDDVPPNGRPRYNDISLTTTTTTDSVTWTHGTPCLLDDRLYRNLEYLLLRRLSHRFHNGGPNHVFDRR